MINGGGVAVWMCGTYYVQFEQDSKELVSLSLRMKGKYPPDAQRTVQNTISSRPSAAAVASVNAQSSPPAEPVELKKKKKDVIFETMPVTSESLLTLSLHVLFMH